MSSDIAIRARDLGRLYYLYDHPRDRLKQVFLWGRRKLYREFWALRGVSFDVKKGEAFGVIGRNGSGKSTLLQIIAGTLEASEGSAAVRGKTTALLELGSGFNPEFSGRENVYLNGTILGLSKREIDERLDEILDFAAIGEFIDQPIKTYSSGMAVRLAFAVQVCIEPEVLVVDEALSVGDIFFQQKCFQRIRDLLARGASILFVSHDLAAVESLCTDALLLHQGKAAYCGSSAEAISRYHEVGAGKAAAEPTTEAAAQPTVPVALRAQILEHDILDGAAEAKRHGTNQLEIIAASVTDQSSRPRLLFRMMDRATIAILCRARRAMSAPNVGVEIFDRFGTLVFAIGALQANTPLAAIDANGEVVIEVTLELALKPGEYVFSLVSGEVAADNPNAAIDQSRIDGLGPIVIHYPADELFPFYGIARLDAQVRSAVPSPDRVPPFPS